MNIYSNIRYISIDNQRKKINLDACIRVSTLEEVNERNNGRRGATNLQLLVNLLLDRSAHLRRVDSHYSRARSVGALERVSSSVETSLATVMTTLLLASATRLTNTDDIGAHTLSRHREAVPRDDGGDSCDDATTPTELLHGSPCSREATAQR